MIAYFFHFCQSDFGNLWGSGVVGGEEVGGEAANFSHFPHLRCLSAHAPKNEIFRQTHCNPAPGMVQYRVSSYVSRHACMTGEHRLRHSCKALEWRFNCE